MCVRRAQSRLVTWLCVLADCLCFVRELRKFNSHYVSSLSLKFIRIQPGGVLLQAPEVLGGAEGESVTWQHQVMLVLTSLYVAFLIQKMQLQHSETALQLQWGPVRTDHLAEPTEWLSLQAQGAVTHGGKPCMNKSTAPFISRNSA